ncbi:ABC transporter substrate-binding protein [Listeria booriae]|uniref:ABC transporter substrate-binding protein n=1 Tax=Listeria booriae TaxID=1552123 RepID=UPI00163DBE4C|nr:extracellular solute-binding protein [Listeria booriae]MBC1306387.1 extracellular solute-binding protein [Listeria booriae]
MKKWMKWTVTAMATVGLGVLVTGCGGAKNDAADADTKKIELKYANWNLGTESDKNIERRMIDAYNKANKDVKIVIDKSITGDDYQGSLTTAASAGKLPDVFMINDIPNSYKNDWLLDLTKMTAEDEDFASISDEIKGTTMVNDMVVAMPFAKHILGYYVNKDILDELNLDVPEQGISIADFVKNVKAATNLDKNIVGTDSAQAMIDWYPGAVNKDMGWFTFTNNKFALDGKEMVAGMNAVKDLTTNGYSYNDLTTEQKEKMSADDSGAAFKAGQIAFYYNGTYMNADLQKNADFNFEFIGLPGGRNAIVNDYLGISKSTKHAKEAYEFAKYMSYGKKGFMERMAISEKNGLELSSLPITDDKEVTDKYWELVTVPGVQAANENLANAMFDPTKVVPGYIQARFEAPTGLKIGDEENANIWYAINEASKGTINYQDYAKQLQELAQKSYDEAAAAMNSGSK